MSMGDFDNLFPEHASPYVPTYSFDVPDPVPTGPDLLEMPNVKECYICARGTNMALVYPERPGGKNQPKIKPYVLRVCQPCGVHHSLYPQPKL